MVALPEDITRRLEERLLNVSLKGLKPLVKEISEIYRKAQEKGQGAKVILNEAQTLAYTLYRFPATYAVNSKVVTTLMREFLSNETRFGSILDLGSGPGTLSLAFREYAHIEMATLVDLNSNALELARYFLEPGPVLNTYPTAILEYLDTTAEHYDIIGLSYVLNEYPLDLKRQVLESLKSKFFKDNYIVIIEPGTPLGFEAIMLAKEIFSGYILAPCSYQDHCPVSWCHFKTRVQRTKSMRYLKDGTCSYEDEPFCYLIIGNETQRKEHKSVIINTPRKLPHATTYTVCCENKEIAVPKKDKRNKLKLGWGDYLPLSGEG